MSGLVDIVFKRIPNVFWANMATKLMQEICGAFVEGQNNPLKCSGDGEEEKTEEELEEERRSAKEIILSIFLKFLEENFSVENTKVLSERFKNDFLQNILDKSKHPMASLLENDYISLFVLYKIVKDQQANNYKDNILYNVLKSAIETVEHDHQSNPKSKAHKAIQLIKDQLKPKVGASCKLGGGYEKNNKVKEQLMYAIDSVRELKKSFSGKNGEQIEIIETQLNNLLKNMRTVSGGGEKDDKTENADVAENTDVKDAYVTEPDKETKADSTAGSEITAEPKSVAGIANVQGGPDVAGLTPGSKSIAGVPGVPGVLGVPGVPGVPNPLDELKGIPGADKLNVLTDDAKKKLKELGMELPSRENIAVKIVEEIFHNFSPEKGKGYEQIREDIYIKFMDALRDHLLAPEGRQMYLRQIEPFFSACIDSIIDEQKVAMVTVIHLVSKVSNIKTLVESSLAEYFDPEHKLMPEDRTLPDLMGHIMNKIEKTMETLNPLNGIYMSMPELGYDSGIILKKQDKDYASTLCSKYAPVEGISSETDKITPEPKDGNPAKNEIPNIVEGLNVLNKLNEQPPTGPISYTEDDTNIDVAKNVAENVAENVITDDTDVVNIAKKVITDDNTSHTSKGGNRNLTSKNKQHKLRKTLKKIS